MDLVEPRLVADRRPRRPVRPARAAGHQPLQGGRAQPGVHRHRPQGQGGAQPRDRGADHRPVGAEGHPRRRHVRHPVRAEARHPRPLLAPHLGADPRRRLRARASSSTSRASRSSRSAATPTRSGSPPSASSPSRQDVEAFTQEVLAGALRSIVGGLTVEQIIRDRAAFAQRVADESENSLTGQGLILDTFQIQDVTDDGTYLADLGRPEAARIGQTASHRRGQRPPGRRAGPDRRRAGDRDLPARRWRSSRPRSRPRPTPPPPRPPPPARWPRPTATRRS